VYTFDENVAAILDDTAFFLYEADGTRHASATGTCSIGSTNAKEVTCGFAPATAAEIHRSVVGTVAFGAVADAGGASTGSNPEGAKGATGTNGTPQA
jgi:hypothetical protein